MYVESNMETYTTICKIDSHRVFAVFQETQTGALYQPRRVGWGGKNGREVQKGGDES